MSVGVDKTGMGRDVDKTGAIRGVDKTGKYSIALIDDLRDYFLDYTPEISREDADWNNHQRLMHGVRAIVERHIAHYRPEVYHAVRDIGTPYGTGVVADRLSPEVYSLMLRQARKAGAPTLDNVSDKPPPNLRDEIGTAIDLEVLPVWHDYMARLARYVKEHHVPRCRAKKEAKKDKSGGIAGLTGIKKARKTKK